MVCTTRTTSISTDFILAIEQLLCKTHQVKASTWRPLFRWVLRMLQPTCGKTLATNKPQSPSYDEEYLITPTHRLHDWEVLWQYEGQCHFSLGVPDMKHHQFKAQTFRLFKIIKQNFRHTSQPKHSTYRLRSKRRLGVKHPIGNTLSFLTVHAKTLVD